MRAVVDLSRQVFSTNAKTVVKVQRSGFRALDHGLECGVHGDGPLSSASENGRQGFALNVWRLGLGVHGSGYGLRASGSGVRLVRRAED